jgi:hypothetical protein
MAVFLWVNVNGCVGAASQRQAMRDSTEPHTQALG